jgi:hypothetical protein
MSLTRNEFAVVINRLREWPAHCGLEYLHDLTNNDSEAYAFLEEEVQDSEDRSSGEHLTDTLLTYFENLEPEEAIRIATEHG